MHMVSKRDFNSAELETVRTSRSPTTMMTANGVHKKTEAYQTSGTLMMVASCVTPMLVLPNSQAFDTANGEILAERNHQTTEGTYYVSGLDTALPDWKICEVRLGASVDIASRGNVTLGVAVGPRRSATDQLLAKANVIRAMREGVRLSGRADGICLPP